jgi:bacteriocin biosynthesis cyclodehydratase domain-containing protein
MVVKLDARVPLVWRDPFSLQLGVEPARVVLRDVSLFDERMIAALSVGVSRSGLSMIAKASGSDEEDVVRLLAALTPVLEPAPIPTFPPRISIVGTGPTVERIAAVIAESGARVEVHRTASAESSEIGGCDLGIAVGHYVLDPELYGFWLRRDIPHLPVLFGDDSVTIGPLVEPGRSACLYCVEHYRRDTDERWSAIASQLWGKRSAAETPLASREAAAIAGRIALRRLDTGAASTGLPAAAASVRLTASTGELVRREWMPHPDCGCVELPAPAGLAVPRTARQTARQKSPRVSAVRKGSGSPVAAVGSSGPRPPTTAAADDEPA